MLFHHKHEGLLKNLFILGVAYKQLNGPAVNQRAVCRMASLIDIVSECVYALVCKVDIWLLSLIAFLVEAGLRTLLR